MTTTGSAAGQANPDTASTRRRRNPRGAGDRLRADIVDAAAALVAAAGAADDLSLRAVAREIGIAAPSIYRHFPDLDHLKAAVVEQGYAISGARREAACAGLDEPVERLFARCRSYVRFGLDHPGHYRLMYGRQLPTGLQYDHPGSPGRHALASLADSIARCRTGRPAGSAGPESAAGAERGPQSPDSFEDPLTTAMVVWTGLHGIVILRLDRPGFPWPPLDFQTEACVRRLAGLAR